MKRGSRKWYFLDNYKVTVWPGGKLSGKQLAMNVESIQLLKFLTMETLEGEDFIQKVLIKHMDRLEAQYKQIEIDLFLS